MRVIIGSLVGALLGFAYYKLVGCSSGTCPITSSPWGSTFYGAIIGFMIASMGVGNDTGISGEQLLSVNSTLDIYVLAFCDTRMFRNPPDSSR